MGYSSRGFRCAVVAGAAALGVVVTATAGLRLTYNTTASLPVGVYRIRPLAGPPDRGDVVGVCLDEEFARLAVSRGYVHPQGLEPLIYGVRCPGGAAAIGKPVAAVPGDTVEVGAEGVRVNGTLLPRSRATRTDRAGRAIPAARPGRIVLREGEFWLQSTYSARSFDSRVFGPVRHTDIVDRRVPVWVRPAGCGSDEARRSPALARLPCCPLARTAARARNRSRRR